MFDPFDHEDFDLDAAIARVYSYLMNLDPESKEFQATTDRLTDLYALKNQAAQLNFQAQTEAVTQKRAFAESQWEAELATRPFYQRIDPNTALTVVGNILIGFAVIKYEQTGVISSKVMSFMKKI